jgi:hypothetical protein
MTTNGMRFKPSTCFFTIVESDFMEVGDEEERFKKFGEMDG